MATYFLAQGILSEGSTMDRIAGNEIHVPVTDQMAAFGIYMYRGLDHKVLNNTLTLHGTTPGLNWGIVNRGMKFTIGLVQGNELDKLRIGTQTESHNPYLQILCNDYFEDMEFDWVNNPFSQGSYLGPQGTGCDPDIQYRAGNRFYNTGNDHIYSWAQPFEYYYNLGTIQEPVITVTPLNVDGEACTEGPEGDPSCAEEEVLELPALHERRMMLDSLVGELEGERAAVEASLDSIGFKTDTLLTHIADTGYSKVLLTNELVSWSLLSDTVLLATVQRVPALGESQLQKVLVHNSPLSHKVWREVKGLFIDFKPETIDTLISAQSSDSLRTLGLIDQKIASAKTIRHRTIMDYLEGHLDKDSIIDSTYTAINYMLALGEKEFYKLAVGTTLSLDTLEWSRTLLDTMDIENAEDTAFYQWHDLALTLKEDTLTWFDLDSTQIESVRAVASDSTEMKGYAEAVLALLGDSSITRTPEPMPELPSGRYGQDEQQPAQQITIETDASFNVYPNPLTNDFTVNYSLKAEAKELRFEVFDITGRRIRDSLIRDTQIGTERMDLTPCSGLYLLRVIADGKQIYATKLICVER